MADDLQVIEQSLPEIRKKSLATLNGPERRKFDACLAHVARRFDQGADSITIGRELMEQDLYHQDCISGSQCVIDYWRSRRAESADSMKDAQFGVGIEVDPAKVRYCGRECKTITNRIGRKLCAHSGLTCGNLSCDALK